MEKKTVWDMERPSVDDFRRKTKLSLAVIVDNVRSLNNIGSIFRTSDAFLVEKIVLCGISATPAGAAAQEIHKTALGAEYSVLWEYRESTLQAVKEYQARGYTVVCLEQVKGSVALQDFKIDPEGKYALVAGNEVEGVQQCVVDAADVCVEIPQEGTKHSLNVAVSTGILLWQLFSGLFFGSVRVSDATVIDSH